MNSVRWTPKAQRELAEIWTAYDAARRKRLTIEIQLLEGRLIRHPNSVGESRSLDRRVVIVRDAVVDFKVRLEDRLVIIEAVRPRRSIAD